MAPPHPTKKRSRKELEKGKKKTGESSTRTRDVATTIDQIPDSYKRKKVIFGIRIVEPHLRILNIVPLFRFQQLVKFLRIRADVFEPEVKIFYAHLEYNDGALISHVHNVEIRLTRAVLSEIFEMPNEGYDVYNGNNWPSTDVGKDEGIPLLFDGSPFVCSTPPHLPTRWELGPRVKALHHVLIRQLFPRDRKDNSISFHEAGMLAFLLMRRRINMPAFLMHHMFASREKASLPYGMVLTKIFEHFGVPLYPDHRTPYDRLAHELNVGHLRKIEVYYIERNGIGTFMHQHFFQQLSNSQQLEVLRLIKAKNNEWPDNPLGDGVWERIHIDYDSLDDEDQLPMPSVEEVLGFLPGGAPPGEVPQSEAGQQLDFGLPSDFYGHTDTEPNTTYHGPRHPPRHYADMDFMFARFSEMMRTEVVQPLRAELADFRHEVSGRMNSYSDGLQDFRTEVRGEMQMFSTELTNMSSFMQQQYGYVPSRDRSGGAGPSGSGDRTGGDGDGSMD